MEWCRPWVGGSFQSVAGVTCANLARLDADGTVDRSFTAPAAVGGAYDYVGWVYPLADGRVLVGGQFEGQRPFGGPDENLVRLQADGAVDTTFESDLSGLFLLSAAVLPDGTILAAGMLHSWTGGSHYFVRAELEPDGRIRREFPPDAIPAMVIAVVLQPDGKAVIGGAFETVYGAPRNGVARLNADGRVDPGFHPPERAGLG